MNKKGFFLMAMLSVVLTACGNKEEQQKVAPVRVVTEVVGSQVDKNTRTYVGEVEAESSTSVSFTGSGTVLRVAVEEGQHVQKGQFIAEMDATQARNMLANCEAQMRQANDALERMKQLHDQNALPEVKWVETQSQVAQAKAQLDMARKSLADCRIYAPVSGVIGQKTMSSGETALPSQPVCTILNINNVKVKVAVPEKEIGRFSASTPTEIRVEALGETFMGGAIEKGVQADPVSRTYEVRINVENPGEKLLAGMVCEVKTGGSDTVAALETGNTTVMVPITAVQRSADGSMFVWKAEGGKAHRAKVTLGEASGNRIEVTSGVKKGEKVIVKGYQKVSEGSEVEEI
ncbi:MAG: efflux RND transporter periplasmic adaptor subunit [Bacteroidaceae bacterium]|nr:efflux RND transporter periplasmic adaptor subunit [Bacteroidaceae bacterium]